MQTLEIHLTVAAIERISNMGFPFGDALEKAKNIAQEMNEPYKKGDWEGWPDYF